MSIEKKPTILFLQDGDRRWAQQHNVSLDDTYVVMAKKIGMVVDGLADRGFDRLYVPGCSVANLQRPPEQIPPPLNAYLRIPEFTTTDTRIKVSGDPSLLPGNYPAKFEELASQTANKKGFTLNLLMCWSMVDEVARIAGKLAAAGAEITPESLLDASDITEPIDLIIRTGGRNRLSSFIPLSGQFAEIVFSDVLFPDYTLDNLDNALEQYHASGRTYGK